MRNKILGWIGIVWGGLIVLNGIAKIIIGNMGSGAYAVGQVIALGIGAWMFYAGLGAVRKK